MQGELEAAIERITGTRVRVVGAGRTDAGVHAWAQVASFTTESELTARVWQRALNAHLPPTIAAREVRVAPEGFHARFSALSRSYRYTIVNRPVRSAIGRQYHWHVRPPLDVGRMDQAVRALVGRHDFAAYAGSSGDARGSTVRTVLRAGCSRFGDEIFVDVEADAFLTHMVRNIVGTLVQVGGGAKKAQTAPPHGLCLVSVNYGDRL